MQRLTRDEVRRHIRADPRTVYDLISDITRTPEWSPEVVACTWLEGATGPAVGARFTARNKRRWFAWSNTPIVVAAEPGRAFAVSRTEVGGGTIEWRYDLTPERGGTTLTQSYEVVRSVPIALHWVLRLLLGVRDLQADLHANMVTSLARIATIAERGSATAAEVRTH